MTSNKDKKVINKLSGDSETTSSVEDERAKKREEKRKKDLERLYAYNRTHKRGQGRPKKGEEVSDPNFVPDTLKTPLALRATAFAKTAVDVLRTELGLQDISGIKLAELMGKSQTFIAWRLNGRKEMELETILQIAAILDITAFELFEETERQLIRREAREARRQLDR